MLTPVNCPESEEEEAEEEAERPRGGLRRTLPSYRLWLAVAIALASDAVQIAVFPLFVEGAVSPWNDGLDGLVGLTLTLLVGWHWAFLPSLVAELVPGIVVVPTWTAAILLVAWKKHREARRNP